ncbi:MAG: SBBP repeat-containing protein [Bryobacteraceae bacterium]
MAYQVVSNLRRPVAAEYVIDANDEVRLRVGQYDAAKPLVIDPVIAYWAYIGGTTEVGESIAIDPGQCLHFSSTASAAGFQTASPFQPVYGGGSFDAFVTKINPAGTAIVYSTYLGGSGNEAAHGIAVDGNGQAYLTGETSSTNYPLLSSLTAFQEGQPTHLLLS